MFLILSLILGTALFELKYGGQVAGDLPVRSPGRLALAAHVQDGRRVAESNALHFDVSEPTGAEAEVFTVVREAPHIMEGGGEPTLVARRRELLETHPHSRYLIWARLQQLKITEGDLRNGWDSETNQPLWALPASSRRSRYLELAKEAAGGDWGHFEDDALSLALTAAWNGGDDVSVQRITKTLLERHPKSTAAHELKRSRSRR